MPSGPLTFLDLKKFEATPGYDLVEENVRLSPELSTFPADVMEGTAIELTVRLDLPTVNFVNIGEGVTESKSGYISRLFQCANLDALVKVPVNMLVGKPSALVGRLLAAEQSGFVEAAIRTIGKQTWYGVGNDAKGFVGIIAQMLAANTIDATGTTGGEKSSVFFVSVGANKAEYWFGNNRTLTFDDWQKLTVNDAAGKPMEAETSWMHSTPGFRLSNRNAVVRIKNLTTQAGKTLTWALMNAAYQKMTTDLGMIPTHIFMSGREQEYLRVLSITPENPNPPLPEKFHGIPILVTHNIIAGETI